MNTPDEKSGIVLHCDLSGEIIRVIRDDLGATAACNLPATLFGIVDPQSREKAHRFLEAAIAAHATFGWELNFYCDGQLTGLVLTGSVTDQGIIVCGSPSRLGLNIAFDEIMKIQNEQLNALRMTLKDDQLNVTALQLREQAVLSDFTHLNNELVNTQRELARRNAELTRAKQLADDANKAKSEFLANMSHEIRTPMNGIIGMTELALTTLLSADQKEYLDTIKESGDALLKVINDILDFSKVEAGKLDLDIIDFNLPKILEATMRVLAGRAHEKGLELICQVDPGVPKWVSGDPDRIRQIVMNLVSNAIKFTARGEVALTVSVQESPRDDLMQSLLHFTVSDTGIGIPSEKQTIIFDAFSQADSSTTRQFGGTGLGLTISSRLVALMDGKIWVESKVGEGSKFHFTAHLPAALNRPDETSVSQLATLENSKVLVVDDNAARTALSDSSAPARPLNILLAEDNRINQRVATRILQMAGHQVTVAENGKLALALLESSAFDAVLMDVQMPVMGGFEATATIRKAEEKTGRHLPIIAMTAHALKGDRERCLEAGMDGYISKPMSSQELQMALTAAI